MSSTNKTANYQLSQFVGTDIPSILNDYNGDMRKIDNAIKEVANAEGSSASVIAGLQATVGQHTTEIGGLSSNVNSLSGRVIGIESKIPASASADNKLITESDIPEVPDITRLENDVSAIKSVIPANASSTNKLVTNNEIENIDDNITDLLNHRYRKLYSYDDSKTLLENANAIWTAFRNSLSSINAGSIVNNIMGLVLYDGMNYYRCDGAPNAGGDILTFTALKTYGSNFDSYSINFTLAGSGGFGGTISNMTSTHMSIDATGAISFATYTPNIIEAYVIGGTF